jgi:acetyltransferase-like isoleucine patch superfamily enzyme
MTTDEMTQQGSYPDAVESWPGPRVVRTTLAIRHVLPSVGTRALGRGMRSVINRGRRGASLSPAVHAYCARSVRIRNDGDLILEGGYRIEDNVELILGTDGHGSSCGKVVLGNNVVVRSGCVLSADGGVVRLGAETYIGYQCVLLGGTNGLAVGARVMFGPQCLVVANNHGLRSDVDFGKQSPTSAGITIADNVWIGGHATIVDGVTIGSGSVVAAGAVVTRDVADRTLVAGVPARVVRELA